jgi:hypothetical protein
MFRVFLFSLYVCVGLAFAPLPVPRMAKTARLMATWGVSLVEDDDLYFRQMISKARECAFSDDSSATDARRFLNEILHFESACVSGNLSGDTLCDNVEEVAEIVAHLRVKAENDPPAPTSSISGLAPPYVGSFAFLVTVALLRLATVDAGAFTVQEWIWAARGGYLDGMAEHFIRNGGL